jgi:hypothetical protein
MDAPYEIFQKKSKGDEALACSRMLLCLSLPATIYLRTVCQVDEFKSICRIALKIF